MSLPLGRLPGYRPMITQVDPPPQRRLVLDQLPDQFPRQGGVGGWRENDHPRGKSTTEWRGRPLHRMSFDVFLDALRRGDRPDVERECALLHSFGLPVNPTDPMSDPPRLALNFGAGQQLRWVVDDLDWQEEQRLPGGRRVQALVTVHLLEHRSADLAFTALEQVEQDSPATTDSAPSEVNPGGLPLGRQDVTRRTYTVRAGDNLISIAATLLGDPDRYLEICRLNQLPDCDLITVGQVLRLPSS